MQFKHPKLCFVLLILFYTNVLSAQISVITSGGNSSGSNGSLSYTVGQTTANYTTSTTAKLSEGVQQPYEISIVTQLQGSTEVSLIIAAFPNITSKNLTLKIEQQTSTQKFAYQLIDLNGVIIESKNNIGAETQISLGNLMAATYLIKVFQDSKEIKLFKIIKK